MLHKKTQDIPAFAGMSCSTKYLYFIVSYFTFTFSQSDMLSHILFLQFRMISWNLIYLLSYKKKSQPRYTLTTILHSSPNSA